MRWKENSKEIAAELQRAQDANTQLDADGKASTARLTTPTERSRKAAVEAEQRFQNTLRKLGSLQEQSEEQLGDASHKLKGKEEALFRLQAREVELKEVIVVLEKENGFLKGECARLRTLAEGLERQLQAEKKGNLAFLRSDGSKKFGSCNDGDDDEPLPGVRTPTATNRGMRAPSPPPKAFKMPMRSLEDCLAAKPVTAPPPPPTTTKKRKRSQKESLDEELADLEISEMERPTGARKKRQVSYRENFADEDDEVPRKSTRKRVVPAKDNDEIPYVPDFDFTAITTSHPGHQTPSEFFPARDLTDCDFLLDRIRLTHDIRERRCGQDWVFAFFQASNKPVVPPCVTRKLARKKTVWRKGFEGRYACLDCVGNGRPCFVFDDDEEVGDEVWKQGKFRLLPLHEDDRVKAVVKGKSEVRFWVNDGTEFGDGDIVGVDEGDEEYVD